MNGILELIEEMQYIIQKQEEKIKLLMKSVESSEKSREYWIKKYYDLMDEMCKEEKEDGFQI